MFSATSTVMWTEVPTSGPAARYGFVSGVIEDRYWIISHGNKKIIVAFMPVCAEKTVWVSYKTLTEYWQNSHSSSCTCTYVAIITGD